MMRHVVLWLSFGMVRHGTALPNIMFLKKKIKPVDMFACFRVFS